MSYPWSFPLSRGSHEKSNEAELLLAVVAELLPPSLPSFCTSSGCRLMPNFSSASRLDRAAINHHRRPELADRAPSWRPGTTGGGAKIHP